MLNFATAFSPGFELNISNKSNHLKSYVGRLVLDCMSLYVVVNDVLLGIIGSFDCPIGAK